MLALFASASAAFGQTVLIDNASGSQVQSIQMSAVGEAYAQPFSVGPTAQAISSITVRLRNTAGAPYEFRFALWTDNGGRPERKLAESDVVAELGTTVGLARSKFWPGLADPVLAANDTYWLSVELVSGAMGWDFKGTTENPGGTGGILLAGNRISTDGGETWPGDYSEGGVAMIRMVGSEATSAVVTSVLDSGAGSLRDAIQEANTIAGPSAIAFDPALSGQTIRLDGTELTLSSEVSIDASDLPDGIIISGDRTDDGHTADDSRVFRIEIGAEVFLDSLIITGGRSPNGEEGLFGERNGGGGISNEGTLTMRRCTLAGNTGGPGRDGDAGGDGNGRAAPDGGGIANYFTATIEECTISHNLTGAGGDAALDFKKRW